MLYFFVVIVVVYIKQMELQEVLLVPNKVKNAQL